MKNLLSLVLLTSAIAVSIQADGEPVCAPSDFILSQLKDKRYEQIEASSPDMAKLYFDTQTIKIDKKKKTVDIWVFDVPNAFGRENLINSYGDAFQNIGLVKQRNRFFYSKNKMTALALINHDCDGNTISQGLNLKIEAYDIAPNSSGEAQIQHITKKYNLK